VIPKLYRRYLKRLIRPVPHSYGKDFKHWRCFLEESQWWAPEELAQHQNHALRNLIRHCYQNVPYYRDLFNERGVKPEDIRETKDLQRLPFLTKEIIKANPDRLKAGNIALCQTEFHTTGGTTGTPLGLTLEKRSEAIRLAFEWRFYGWAGYRFGDRCAVLRGLEVDGFEKGRRWEYDPYRNYLILSAFDMTDGNMKGYVEKLREFRPKYIRGYPSALGVLSRFVLENGLKINPSGGIKGVFTSSETLYEFEREQITEAFGAPVFDLYGNTEQAGRFGQCECLEGYHDFVEYSVVEIEGEDDSGIGELVATPLTNYAMPLLRYRTGDLARRSCQPCRCGRGLPLIAAIEGRRQDVAVLQDGTPVSLTGFFFAVHVPEMSRLKKIQFQQEAPGHLRALVVKGEHYPEGCCESMLARMNQNLAKPFRIEVRFVEEIPTTRAGKHRFFVSKIGGEDGR